MKLGYYIFCISLGALTSLYSMDAVKDHGIGQAQRPVTALSFGMYLGLINLVGVHPTASASASSPYQDQSKQSYSFKKTQQPKKQRRRFFTNINK